MMDTTGDKENAAPFQAYAHAKDIKKNRFLKGV